MDGKTFWEYLIESLEESKVFGKMCDSFKVFGRSNLSRRMVKNFFHKNRKRNIYTFIERVSYPYNYFLLEVGMNHSNKKSWNLILDFPLPRYTGSLADNLVKDLFYRLLRSIDVNNESRYPCRYDGGIRFSFPIISVGSKEDGEKIGMRLNSKLRKYREGFERAFNEIRKIYPVSDDVADNLISRFRRDADYGLDFLEQDEKLLTY